MLTATYRTTSLVRTLVLLGLAAAALFWSASAFAVDTATRTDAEIQTRWHQLAPIYTDTPYSAKPAWDAPYSLGSLTWGFSHDGLNAVNYCRYLAGLADDVSLDTTYTDYAQHGAILLNVAGFSHTPSKPAEMDAAFYNLGYKGTSSGNIGMGDTTLAGFVFSCMNDSDEDNIRMVGHRRWILDPPMARTGFGFANYRSVMYAFDVSRRPAAVYDTVRWPCAGAFPVELFPATDPWSVTLNPAIYAITPGSAGHTVTMRRESDGKTWTFTSADTDPAGEFFNLETSRYGIANCFIFRPDPASIGAYRAGDVYDITLSGGIKKVSGGQAVTVSYKTRFMSQDGPVASIKLSGASKTKVRRTYTLAGRLTPSSATGRVGISLSRRVSGHWKSAGATSISLVAGRFHYGFKPKYRGMWKVTVRYGGLSMSAVSVRGTVATKGFTVK